MHVDNFRKILLLKSMILRSMMDESEFVEVTVKIPKYIASAVGLCTYCWSKDGMAEKNFDTVISSILDDGIRLRFQKDCDDIEKIKKIMPTQCLVCIAAGRSVEVKNESDGKTVRSDGHG